MGCGKVEKFKTLRPSATRIKWNDVRKSKTESNPWHYYYVSWSLVLFVVYVMVSAFEKNNATKMSRISYYFHFIVAS
jgi:hypothetical protein